MPSKFHHEELYRGAELAQKLASVRVTLCGAARSARTWPIRWPGKGCGTCG